MKNFKEFLTESQKTYKFKICVAGELPEGFADRLETNLQKFDLVNVSTGKKSPITEQPLDFPKLQNMEVHHFEAEVKYPTTSFHLQEYLIDNCSVDRGHLKVKGEFDPLEELQNTPEKEEYEALLATEDMGGTSGQDSVAGNRVMDLLKELETARKEREIDPMEGAPKGESKDIDSAENTKAVLGN